ncbi:MAG: nucleotidyltransferase family protein [Myxococcales bacterium]|jgi:molybdenum cofactor cytidylyltransferase
MSARVACAVLGAGASRRLGYPKQLALHRGVPLVRWAALCATRSTASETALVVGAHGQEVSAAVAGLPLTVLDNAEWSEGLASSIRCAVTWATQRDCAGLLLVLCDQPRLTAPHLSHLVHLFDQGGIAVASRYAGKNAVPAIFSRLDFAALGALRGDNGAGPLLNSGALVVDVAWPDGAYDVDTPEEARALLKSSEESP